MENEALLNVYIEKLRLYTVEKLNEKDISILKALKESLHFLEGEMKGY